MADAYKTAIGLTLNDNLERELLTISRLFGALDKSIIQTQSRLNKLTLPGKLQNEIAKLGGAFLDVSTKAIEGNQRIIASYSAMSGKLVTELRSLKGVSADVASTMGREFKGAIGGVSSEVATLKRQLTDLQSQMRSSGGRSIRHGGGGGGVLDTIAMGPTHSGIFAGRAIEHSIVGGLVSADGELKRQLNLYRLGGASAPDVAAARSAAFRSATIVPDVGVAEQAKLLRELSAATGDEAGARAVLPQAAKTMSMMGAITGRKSEADMARLFKFIELRGVAIDHDTHKIDAGKFGAELDYATKAMTAAQGLITSNDMLQFAKQAGPMAKGMSGEDLFTNMLAAMEDMGGARTGTSLTAVGRQFVGGIMTGGKAQRLRELGLLNAAGVEESDKGGLKVTDPTQAIKGYDVLTSQGFGAFMEKVFRPALATKGITDPQKQNEELYRSVGTDTGRRLMGLFLSGKPQIDMVAERYRKAMGGAEGYDKIFGAGEDLQTSTKALHEAFGTLKTALGDAPAVSAGLMAVAKGIASIADLVKDRPAIGTAATMGGAGASAALLGYGALQTVKGFGLPAAAAELTVAAKMLQGAAATQGGMPGGSQGKGGWLGKVAGVLGIGALAQGAQAVGALQAPKMEDGFWKNVLNFLDPGLAARVIGDGIKKPAEEAGKAAGEATTKGFKAEDYQGAGSAAGSSLLKGFMDIFSKMGGASVSPTGFGGGGGIGGLIQKASLGGGGGAGGPIPGIPDGISMTAGERNTLGLIQKYESGGRNVMNYIGDRRHTAQGYYQITNTNWRRIAPMLGIRAPNAMSATLEEQTRVAHHLLRHGGAQNWTNFNPRLRGALSRGESAPAGQAPPTAPPPPRRNDKPAITHVHLDGKVIAKAVTTRIADGSRYPRHVGGMDTHGSWRPPGTTLTDAA